MRMLFTMGYRTRAIDRRTKRPAVGIIRIFYVGGMRKSVYLCALFQKAKNLNIVKQYEENLVISTRFFVCGQCVGL